MIRPSASLVRRFGRFFVDDAGEPSSMRLMVFLAFCAVLGLWVWESLSIGRRAELGDNDLYLLLACIFGKAMQSRFENAPPAGADRRPPVLLSGDSGAGGAALSPGRAAHLRTEPWSEPLLTRNHEYAPGGQRTAPASPSFPERTAPAPGSAALPPALPGLHGPGEHQAYEPERDASGATMTVAGPLP